MMKRIVFVMFLLFAASTAARTGEGAAGGLRKVPHRVIPVARLGATVRDWPDESLPRYAIIGNVSEWDMNFVPTAADGTSQKPNAAFFNQEMLIAIARVSSAPPAGETVLDIKSFDLENGEMRLTYSFIPPVGKSGPKVKNILLIAIPADFGDYGLRFVEDEETPGSLAAQAELEEAIRAGRFKNQTNE